MPAFWLNCVIILCTLQLLPSVYNFLLNETVTNFDSSEQDALEHGNFSGTTSAISKTDSKTTQTPKVDGNGTTPGRFYKRTRKNRTSSTMQHKLRKFRLEIFKKLLLSKLKLANRPHPSVVSKNKLPLPIIKGEVLGRRDKVFQTSGGENNHKLRKNLIIFPNRVQTSCKRINNDPSSCIFFGVKDQLRSKEVLSALLWVYKLPDPKDHSTNQTFVISELRKTNGTYFRKKRNQFVHQAIFLKSGWMKVDIRVLVQKWFYRPNRKHGVDVSCKTCSMNSSKTPIALDAAHRPFIVLTTHRETQGAIRYKRSFDCSNETTSCCLQRAEFSVVEIGWNDWIVQPKVFQTNECRGTCDGWIPGMSMRHQMLREYGFKLCCGVSKTAPLSVLYYNQNGLIEYDEVNLMAEQCDCV